MNSDEVRVNNSHVLMGEMMNVENTRSNTRAHTHTYTHTCLLTGWDQDRMEGLGAGGGGGSAEGQHRLEGAATVSAVFFRSSLLRSFER